MQDLHKEGECRQLEFWTRKSYVRDTYTAHLQMSWNFLEIYFGINKKFWKQKVPEGATQVPTRHQGAPPPQARPGTSWGPWPASGPHFLVYKSFCPRKNIEKTFGKVRRCLEADLGREHFCSPVERFCQGYFPPGGGNRRHRHHQRSSHRGRTNLHQHLH